MNYLYIFLSVLAAYLIGSIPTAYIFAKALKGVDIREHGSGNVGATNVARVVGKVPGIIVFILDLIKGAVAVIIIPELFRSVLPDLSGAYGFLYILWGISVIAGHVWPVFLKFKGGKGVATTAGVMAGLSPIILVSGLVLWIIIFAIWRYVSLASICASVSLPIFAAIYGQRMEFIIFCSILALVGTYLHRANIRRLINRTEPKLR